MFELIKDILNLPSIQAQGRKCLIEIDALIMKIKNIARRKKKEPIEETMEDE